MRNIWRLFVGDLRRLGRNVVTGIIVIGLVFTPSIFSWYNILACWDVFDNTGSLTVAVANADEGYQSDLIPLKTNIGEQVVSALRANDQLNWKITTEEDAIDGAKSGKYYAAVVIPESFSRDMMTFYSDEVEHAQIVYYTNEKKSAVAPKVTGQGADQVSYQVNEVFSETLSELALGLSSALYNYADNSDVDGRIGVLANHVNTMSTQMAQASSVLTTYAQLMDSAQGLVDGSAKLLGQAQDAAGDVENAASESGQSVSDITDAMSTSADELSAALSKSSAGYANLSSTIDSAFASSKTLAGDTSTVLRDNADAIDAQATKYEQISAALQNLESQVTEEQKPAIENMVTQLDAAIEMQKKLSDSLKTAADDIDTGSADADQDLAKVKELAAQAEASVNGITTDYENDVKPILAQLEDQVSSVAASLHTSADELDSAANDLKGTAGSVSEQLGDAKQKLLSAADDLTASAGKLSALSQAISQALSTGDSEALRNLLSSDPETLATALAAPVQLERHAVFPADNFGSQMAPLYTTLALWIGSLLLVVAIKVNVSEEEKKGLSNPKPRQLFLGRFGVFAVMSLAQSTVMALGNMFFLGVQVNEPVLYLLCFWISGLVFTFFIYALVVSFANLGKAIAVFLLIVQVTGGGGSFPLQMLPGFVQQLSPYLPATHVINAMRAAMMGVYMNDFWIEIGYLLIFLIPAALLGLALRKPLVSFLNWYVEKVEASKLAA